MATIIAATIPVEEFALAETLATCEDAIVECERVIESSTETVLPLVWVRETSPAAFEAALDQDPTVGSYTQLAGTETETLYEMDWSANIRLMLRILTTERAVILSTVGRTDRWHLRVLFPDRAAVRTTNEFCETHDLTFTIRNIRDLDDEDVRQRSLRAGLTADQHEALTHAYNRGYFAVPRGDDLEAVADDLGISHQALSERLRRGHQHLIETTLVARTDAAPLDQPLTADTDHPADDDSGPSGNG